jgi:hypothetical protein
MITTILLLLVVVVWFSTDSSKSQLPLANPPRWFQTEMFQRLDFLKNGIQVYDAARKQFGDKPYRLIMEYGECFVLSSNDLRVVQTEKNLNFGKAIASVSSIYCSCNIHTHSGNRILIPMSLDLLRLVYSAMRRQWYKTWSKST